MDFVRMYSDGRFALHFHTRDIYCSYLIALLGILPKLIVFLRKYINNLHQLSVEDSLYTAKFALSDLNTKVKDLEHEKASLTTTVKIL